jgi:hypothetical protein
MAMPGALHAGDAITVDAAKNRRKIQMLYFRSKSTAMQDRLAAAFV